MDTPSRTAATDHHADPGRDVGPGFGPDADAGTADTVELSAGPLAYTTAGSATGPTLVLLHGLMGDGSLWDACVADLAADHRCVVPTLPLGAHRHAMRDDADLSLTRIAALVGEFLDTLGLDDVTLVGNDTGGALVQLLIDDDDAARDATREDGRHGTDRVARVVLVSCDAFDNYPPGLTGRTLVLTGRLSPRLFGAFMQQMRLRLVRRLPIAFGWLTRRGDAATARWMRPTYTRNDIRRDTVRVLRSARADARALAAAGERLPAYERPALVVWASEDRVMPPAHGRRLAELLPQGRLVEIDDSLTLIPLDQPERLAAAIREFTAEGRGSAAGGAAEPGPAASAATGD
ncbi:alpha/beta fold hydrolase [Yinghuangia seranimata]|uniref:alpha/beta fold hydrolase n=1 Tax=Yinghuangia seranimata TaxID=408067 RepID=UPI00248C1998|nr:alpha/beta hydrolase [Yinghuangia seranimata]MDI2127753.1 alpha/beta hydrolase [Yinghuangia seranimata]